MAILTTPNSEDIPRFEGNPNLKKMGAQIAFTMDMAREYHRCAEDPVYFIQTYYKIITLDKGLQPFIPYRFQKRMIKTCADNRFVIAKLSRQVGKTTVAAAIILWHVLFHKEYTVAILANKRDQAIEILERVQLAYENLPLWLQQGIVIWNRGSILLENKSKIFTAATASSGIRGRSVNFLYLDEFAHIQKNLQDMFYTSTYPVITSGKRTKVLITSTPRGFELFAKMWAEAIQTAAEEPIDALLDDGEYRIGSNGYVAISSHWSDIPGRDEAWKNMVISQTSPEQFAQEFETEFLGSGNTLISGTAFRSLFPKKPLAETRSLRVFENPVPGHIYAITVDTSRGVGLDYNSFVVADITSMPYRIVTTFADNTITPLHFPSYIAEAAKQYNDAIILVETNDNGQQIADSLHFDFECENVLMTSSNGRKGQAITSGFGATARRGIKTTNTVKRVGCTLLKSLVENGKIVLNDIRILDELTHFVVTGPSYAAEPGYHDDLTMCCVLLAWMTGQRYFKDLSNNDIRRLMAEEHQAQADEDLLPFGYFGHEDSPESAFY